MLVVYLLNGNYEPVNVRNKCSGAETVEEWRRRRPFLPAPSALSSVQRGASVQSPCARQKADVPSYPLPAECVIPTTNRGGRRTRRAARRRSNYAATGNARLGSSQYLCQSPQPPLFETLFLIIGAV